MCFLYYRGIQDGYQKWRKTELWQKEADDPVYTMGLKILLKPVHLRQFPRY